LFPLPPNQGAEVAQVSQPDSIKAKHDDISNCAL
jgi:hypothetical protein